MSEEQREILQMISDGKISADDGAKLLEALKVGEQKRREKESPARRVKEKKRRMHEMKGVIPLSGLAGMREMGRMMRGIMRESVSGNDGDFAEIDEEMCEDAGFLEGPIEMVSGTELVLKRRTKLHRDRGGDLNLIGVEGSTLEAVGEDAPVISVYRENGTVYLKWDTGDLTLNVPETVDNVTASIMGGNINRFRSCNNGREHQPDTSRKYQVGDICKDHGRGDYRRGGYIRSKRIWTSRRIQSKYRPVRWTGCSRSQSEDHGRRYLRNHVRKRTG